MTTFAGHTYTNGNVPASILAPLDGDNWGTEPAMLRRDAAAAWNAARAEVLAETGITLTVRGWMRTIAEQDQFFHERYVRGLASADQRYHVHDGVGAWYGRKAGTAAAAIPGDSNHGLGLAVDVVDFGGVGQWDNPRRVATIAILKRHGWTDDEGRGSIQEPWHLVYDPTKDTHPTQEDDDMSKETEQKIDRILDLLDNKVIDGPAGRPKAQDRLTVTGGLRRILIELGAIAKKLDTLIARKES